VKRCNCKSGPQSPLLHERTQLWHCRRCGDVVRSNRAGVVLTPSLATSEATPALHEFNRVMALLRRNAANAARRNKPAMWAYYGRMEERLRAWFRVQVDATEGAGSSDKARVIDGGIAGVALALIQKSERECPMLPRDEAADLWAMGTYATRILAAWRPGRTPRRLCRSLAWLRERAERSE